MKLSPDLLDTWLALGDRAAISQTLRASAAQITLPQARKIAARIQALDATMPRLKIGILRSYSSEPLDPWLGLEAALEGFFPEIYHAPYGFFHQEAQAGSRLLSFEPDLTLLLLRREDLHPGLAEPLVALPDRERQSLQDEALRRLVELIGRLRDLTTNQIVVTLLPPLHGPGLGLIDRQAERSERAWWDGFEQRLVGQLREAMSGVLFLDLGAALEQIGRNAYFDQKYWYSARFPFSAEASRDLARRLISIAAVLQRPKAKVIVLDADNTLWGGIVGEDGPQGIALGHDWPGNCYLAFQRRLLDYRSRGFVLALCSKNNAADVDVILREHPQQLLREFCFVARRVNWAPKPQNLRELASELNLGLESFVFVDDSVHECAAVRHELPQVEVVQVPGNPLAVPTCLDSVARLEILALTQEDLNKTALYAQERERRELKQRVDGDGGSLDDYLRSLDMHMRISLDDRSQVARLTQLVNKTNQFNLTTRRYDEDQMRAFMTADHSVVAHFALADSFGDSGVVGLAIFRLGTTLAELDSFLMSCRVIGRRAESAFLEALLRWLADTGIRQVVGEFLPTPKNALAETFLPDHGFVPGADGRLYLDLVDRPPLPANRFPIQVELT
ncbi:MAG TPA: HAD-IIIC family phosphatase [Chromatiaceae bacterium]|jgi:FkbH-like protein|nr:MAG: hypothetical protein N838_16790 [Thiohalocapsa sp. PB-PSB1]QQO55142.1 MAG: HAD-IIIC family phosphatase [Thiohalocapsa sp. PB-PSB1]HBG94854.1 HAD-IIIC family phosphatase [Chromatiaceae bacterium]HCS91722.1 HAD-IIIC family phosphatase [Chromatiaceae bacterium]